MRGFNWEECFYALDKAEGEIEADAKRGEKEEELD